METQLVRLDKPYNVICSKRGNFALHIGTLVVTKEKKKGVPVGIPLHETFAIGCYPVVGGNCRLDGDVWLSSELKDCLLVCREGESVSLYTLKKVMEFCAKHDVHFNSERTPIMFDVAMMQYGVTIQLNRDENNKTISEYEVSLEFEENENDDTCMVYSSNDSDFYFYEVFVNEPLYARGVQTKNDAIRYLAELRDNYLRILHYEGLRSITFTTKTEQYQWFIDELNAFKEDAEGV